MAYVKDYTIEGYIDSKSTNQVSYDSLSLFEKNENGEHCLVYNVLTDYYDEIMERAVTLNLTTEEYFKYRFRPKLLAYRLYGDPELFFILLFVNNLCNVKDFDFKSLKIILPEDLNDILSSILNSDMDLLTQKVWR